MLFCCPISADDSSANGLRKINIPGDLVSYFLRLASENTRKDLETCGILTGRLVSESISLVMVMGLTEVHFRE